MNTYRQIVQYIFARHIASYFLSQCSREGIISRRKSSYPSRQLLYNPQCRASSQRKSVRHYFYAKSRQPEYYIRRRIMPSIKIPMPRIIDAIGTATPVTLDSAWRKIEYRLDVRKGLEMVLAKVINSPRRHKIFRLNSSNNAQLAM